jgi:hypothetical protein
MWRNALVFCLLTLNIHTNTRYKIVIPCRVKLYAEGWPKINPLLNPAMNITLMLER